MGEKWCLESLTIGPLTHKTDYAFWHNAFHDLPTGTNLKHLNDVTIIYSYPNDGLFVMSSWRYFDEFFSRMDIFPQSMQVDIWMNVGSISPTIHCLPRFFRRRLSSLRRCQLLTFNGTRECGSFWTEPLFLPGYRMGRLVQTQGLKLY